jgi:hypothetical protein
MAIMVAAPSSSERAASQFCTRMITPLDRPDDVRLISHVGRSDGSEHAIDKVNKPETVKGLYS